MCAQSLQEIKSARGETHEVQPTIDVLLVTDGCWEREIKISPGMQPLKNYPCSSAWPYSHVHASSNLEGLERKDTGGGVRKEESLNPGEESKLWGYGEE